MFEQLIKNKNGYVSRNIKKTQKEELRLLLPQMVGKFYKKINRKNPQIYYIISYNQEKFRLKVTTYDNKYIMNLPLYCSRWSNLGILQFLQNLAEATEQDVQTKKLERL